MIYLKDFIENYAHTRCRGDMRIADRMLGKRWNVSQRAVQSWRLLQRVPNVETARIIVKNTKGAVSYEGIYSEYVDKWVRAELF